MTAVQGATGDERVAVIGAGQMGNGISHVFAQSGFPVTMIDVSAEALARGRSTIEKNLDRQLKKGTLDAAAKDATLGRLSTPKDVANAALYLASDEAEFITGVALEVDGGRCI